MYRQIERLPERTDALGIRFYLYDKIVTRIRDPRSQAHDALTPAREGRGPQSYVCQLTALHNVTNTTRLHL
jgi:hypothetical protein